MVSSAEQNISGNIFPAQYWDPEIRKVPQLFGRKKNYLALNYAQSLGGSRFFKNRAESVLRFRAERSGKKQNRRLFYFYVF
jgi:hypothetical protein